MNEKLVKAKPYKTQNDKIWTLNFSALRHVERAKVIIPALMSKIDLQSRGLTILVAAEYCLQERVIKDFMTYVNSKRRGLV